MIEPISLGLCLWFFARWAKRKMEESGASSESRAALVALHNKYGIRYADADGLVYAFDQEHEQAHDGQPVLERNGMMIDARRQSIHFHVHHHYGNGGGQED